MITCSICQRPIPPEDDSKLAGHNAWPVNDGRCCTRCNTRKVIPARLERWLSENPKLRESIR